MDKHKISEKVLSLFLITVLCLTMASVCLRSYNKDSNSKQPHSFSFNPTMNVAIPTVTIRSIIGENTNESPTSSPLHGSGVRNITIPEVLVFSFYHYFIFLYIPILLIIVSWNQRKDGKK